MNDPRAAKHLELEHAYALNQLSGTEPFQQQIREEVQSRRRFDSISPGSVLRGFIYFRRVSRSGTEVDYRQKLLPFGALGPEEIILDHGRLAQAHGGRFADITQLNISVDSRFAVYTVDFDGVKKPRYPNRHLMNSRTDPETRVPWTTTPWCLLAVAIATYLPLPIMLTYAPTLITSTLSRPSSTKRTYLILSPPIPASRLRSWRMCGLLSGLAIPHPSSTPAPTICGGQPHCLSTPP